MDILYIGYLLSEDQYLINGAANTSGGIFEEGLLFELIEQIDACDTLTVFTLTPNDYFPKSKIYSKGNKEATVRGINYQKIAYVNVPFVKQAWMFFNLRVHIYRWIRSKGKSKKIIIQYNLGTPLAQAVNSLRKNVDGVFPIVCDYFVQQSNKSFKDFLHSRTAKAQEKYLKCATGAIVLNECLAKDFDLKNYLIMEGAVSNQMLTHTESISLPDETLKIRYAGAIDNLHGAKVLVELGKLIKRSTLKMEFAVAGRGNAQQDIINASNVNDNALKYVGMLNREEANKFISEADVLLIPHQNSYKQLRYQFSSKMFDYMASGKYVIVSPMPGFPVDYQEYVCLAKSDTAQAFYEEICNLVKLEKTVVADKLYRAQQFAVQKRSWKHQASRLLEFINNLVRESD